MPLKVIQPETEHAHPHAHVPPQESSVKESATAADKPHHADHAATPSPAGGHHGASHAIHHPAPASEKLAILLIAIVALIVLFNQFQITQVSGMLTGGGASTGAASFSGPPSSGGEGETLTLGAFTYGSRITLKPMPLASGEEPVVPGYRSIVKPLPTISELTLTPATGNAAQDLLNNIVPRGVPWYGQQAGVSFDDPITSQRNWAKYRALQLDAALDARWNKITGSFTCDYCCGSPRNPTIITRCGCAHSAAAQGMAKWLLANHGDTYSDEEIYGEMARWYALWYPKGTIERILQESSGASAGDGHAATSLDSLPSMVGGC